MVLKPETDSATGLLRLVGDNTAEDVKFFPGELGVFQLGVFLLGGDDTVRGSSDAELIYGNSDNDQLFGEGGNDTLFGGVGDDQIIGNEGNDLLFGEAGNDQFVGFVNPDNPSQLSGVEGNDTIYAGSGNDQIREGQGEDWIFGGQGNDELRAGADNDWVEGNDGDDFIGGEDGDDTVFGGNGNDQVRGDGGSDLVTGNAGDDQLSGGEGNDTLIGGQGNDQIIGDDGDDWLSGDTGNDNLIGGEGKDIFVLDSNNLSNNLELSDVIVDFKPGEDIILLTGDLGFDDLILKPDPRNENSTILETKSGEIVTVLQSIKTDQINRSNFIIPGSIAFNSEQFAVNENGTPVNPITVVRNSGNDGEISVTVVPVPTRFTPTGNQVDTTPILVNFANGDMEPKIINIPIINNNIPNYSANLLLTLENPTNFAQISTPNQAILDIIDDEIPPSALASLVNPIPETNAQFGSRLSGLGNNFVAITAPGQTNNQGIAYLFDLTLQQPTLNFSNPSPSAGTSKFGQSVATTSQDNIIIGAPQDSSLVPNSGAVYGFSTATGTPYLTINNPNPKVFDLFGYAVASLGNNIIVGAPNDSAVGIAYLFDGNTGQILQTFFNPNPEVNDFFGASVAAVGADRVLIGAPASLTPTGGEKPGEAYIFDSVTGQLLQTFRNPNPGLDNFGYSVAWTGIGRDILIGAPGDDQGGTDGGIAFLFDGITGAVLQRYNAPKVEEFNQFGQALALMGNEVLIGSPGYGLGNSGGTFRYELRTGNLVQNYLSPVTDNTDTDLNFGTSVASVGNLILVGAPDLDITLPSAGAVFQFI